MSNDLLFIFMWASTIVSHVAILWLAFKIQELKIRTDRVVRYYVQSINNVDAALEVLQEDLRSRND